MYVIRYDFRVLFVQFRSQTSDAGYFDVSARFAGTSYAHVQTGVDGRNAILESKTDKVNRFLVVFHAPEIVHRLQNGNTIDACAEKIVNYIVIVYILRVNRLWSSILDQ